ncbi:MAG: hypothetical protein PHF98_04870 [Patescibacteria group bacterium]|nr:hypothetical protein [Patescibacteria group bacterium]
MQIKHATPVSKDDLAVEISKAFQEEHRTDLYRYIVQKHEEATIIRAFDEVTKLPASKIKKSKSALFFYLLNKYGEK